MRVNKNSILCADSLEVMRSMPDNSVDLLLTDPPYGINIASGGKVGGGSKRGEARKFTSVDWDSQTPSGEYFAEMMRVSKNQIIWGGNYFLNYLTPTRCMLVWYKRDDLPERTFADCELAWTSFDSNSRVFNSRWDGFIRDSFNSRYAHPTQKPTELFKWCLNRFAKEGDLILDPFLGTGTTAVAAQEMSCEYIGVEINQEYVNIAKSRLAQGVLF